MNKLFIILDLILLISCSTMTPLAKKYPNILLTADYGILEENDFTVKSIIFVECLHSREIPHVEPCWKCQREKARGDSFRIAR